MAVDLRIFNTVRFRRGHRAEDWTAQSRGTPPVQANRYNIRSVDKTNMIEINLLECLADDSVLTDFEPPPKVVLHLEYFDGKRWVGSATTDDALSFDQNDFVQGVSNPDFMIKQLEDTPNTLQVTIPKIRDNQLDKYRIRVELIQTIPEIEAVTDVGSGTA